MITEDVYERLSLHMSYLGMGYPRRDDLVEILKENFSPLEAEVALSIPSKIIPLQAVGIDEIMEGVNLPKDEVLEVLEGLCERGMIYCGETREGDKGYALHQVGFGFPQTFFWKGEDSPRSRKMAGMVAKYFNRKVTREAYGSETKPYRYIPVGQTIETDKQAVYPFHAMEEVIEQAERIAVAHCPCRVSYALWGKGCEHPTEVCMKFNDMAGYVIERGLAKEISREEAIEIIRQTEEAGLVHFVDNTERDIQHNCNCCGCSCWNVGSIRRRKIPRDAIMATYFLRETDEDACIGCGECVDICPVDALKMEEGTLLLDEEWCIGCGVCATRCSTGAISMKLRTDRTGHLPAPTFRELHEKILEEKDLSHSEVGRGNVESK